MGRLERVTYPEQAAVGYMYDAASNRTAIYYPDGRTVGYAYDPANRLSAVWDGPDQVASYSYQGQRLVGVSTRSGLATAYGYDDGERLTEITQRRTENQELVSQFLYGYDEAANRTAVTETLRLPDATLTTTVGAFGYDGVQRLTAAQYTDGSAFAYGYDAVGNRLAATRTLTSTQTHSYTYDYSPRSAAERDDANRLSVADGVAYTWDAAGNLLSDGVYTYSYDPEQRLVGVTGPGLAWSAGYTAEGLRRWQATNGVTTTYRLDLQPELATVLQAGSPSGTISYVYGLGDSPLAGDSGGVWRYLSGRDALNSVRQETDAASAVLAVRRYDPYGVPLAGDGGQPYGYSGEWWDAETELVYLRARYLRPELGVFTSRDPWPGDMRQPGTLNGYGYGLGNPLKFTDPAGLWTIGIGLGGRGV